MNIRLLIFSGIITGIIGGVIAMALSHLGQPDFNQLKYQSQVYRDLQRRAFWFGFVVGGAVGMGQECVRQIHLKKKEDANEDL
jgi:hypothetical protein